MIGTVNCIYETPCGWCSKWDKECDKKIHTKSYRINHSKPIIPIDESITNKVCKSEEDHEWEWASASTAENKFKCKKCGAWRIIPCEYNITTTTLNI